MATLSEIAYAIESLEVTVTEEKAAVTAKISELTETVENLQSAVEQLKAELAAANDPETLAELASKISTLTGEIAGFVE